MPCLLKQCPLYEDQKLPYFSRLVPDTHISNPQKMTTSLEIKISLLMGTKKCFSWKLCFLYLQLSVTHQTLTYSKSTLKAREEGVKYVQS